MKTISLILISLLLSCSSFAAKIIQVKNGKVLIDLEGEEAAIGDKFFLISSANKKVALATISQVKNSRAIAQIDKGVADGSESIRFVKSSGATPPAKKTKEDDAPVTEESIQVYRTGGTKISGVLTLLSNNMTTKQTDGANPVPNTEDVAMKGSGVGLTGIIDYPVAPWLIMRGTLGYEPFVASGTSQFLSCDGLSSTNCTASINYLSVGGYARFDFTKSRSTAWAALGFTLKQPLSKSTTALLADDIKTTTTLALAAGLDFFINNKSFIPISAEYQMFQSSDTVAANIILLRVGYGISY